MFLFLHCIWLFVSLQLGECKLFIPEIPDKCVKNTICEDVPNYPYEHVEGLIKELEELGYQWQHKDMSYVKNNNDDLLIEGKQGYEESEEMCPSQIRDVENPLAAKDDKGVWRFLINSKNKHIIRIYTVTCENNSRSMGTCQKVCNSGYTNKCMQEYMKRVLMALNEHGKLVQAGFPIPACCSCKVFHDKNNAVCKV